MSPAKGRGGGCRRSVSVNVMLGGRGCNAVRVLTVNTGSSSVKLAVYAGGVRQWSARSGLPFAPAGLPPEAPEAIAHRIVAPLEWSAPRRLDAATLAELQSVTPLVPDHLPQALAAMAACAQAYPGVPQVGCSDSAFHHTML